ncbi:MAG TPA: FHA domain-containing protein [Leptolinea sp.]
MKINFDAIEARLKSLIESSAQLVPGRSQREIQTSRLTNAFQIFVKEQALINNNDLPESIILEVPEYALSGWQAFPIVDTLQAIIQDSGQTIVILPQINVIGSTNLLEDEIHLLDGTQKMPALDKTTSMPTISQAEETYLGDSIPANAFIIVNGLETILLASPVLNIGRRPENDLIIDDQRISREHAQIRAVKGQFVIFDLNSSGGTFVNSIRVSQQPLFPGDVISLAGVPLVYGEDNPPPYSKTGPVEPFYNPDSSRDKS